MSAPSQTKRLIAAAAITGAVLGTAGIAGAATGRFTPNRSNQPAVVVKPFAAVQAGALAGQSRVKAAPVATSTAAIDPATGVTAVVPAVDPTTTTTSTTVVDPAMTTTTVPEADDVNEADEANERPRTTTTAVAGGAATTTATTVKSDDDDDDDEDDETTTTTRLRKRPKLPPKRPELQPRLPQHRANPSPLSGLRRTATTMMSQTTRIMAKVVVDTETTIRPYGRMV